MQRVTEKLETAELPAKAPVICYQMFSRASNLNTHSTFLLSILLMTATGFVATPASAQVNRPCSANLKNAMVRGVKLGMAKTALEKSISGLTWKSKPDGSEVTTISAFVDKVRFDGISKLDVGVFNGKVHHLDVVYNEGFARNNVGEFAADIKKSWRIPERWEGSGLVLLIECRERTAIATIAIPTRPIRMSVVLADNLAAREISQREKLKQKPFRP